MIYIFQLKDGLIEEDEEEVVLGLNETHIETNDQQQTTGQEIIRVFCTRQLNILTIRV